jgi:transposase
MMQNGEAQPQASDDKLLLENHALRSLAEQLQKENALLRERINLLLRKVFGSSSERLDPDQLELLLELERTETKKQPVSVPVCPDAPKPRTATSRDRTPRLPEHLPVVEEVIIPLEVQAAPESYRQIGQEITEQLDYTPASYIRRLLIRNKYVKLDDRQAPPIIAPLPPMLQERCLATPAMIASVITAKYCDHLPLFRQEKILLNRHGLGISRQTLLGWLELAVFWLKPIYDFIKTTVMDGSYIQVDETPIRYLDPGHGKTQKGYMWVVNRPGHGVFFHWEPGRGADCLERIVPANFSGILQCDAYSAYSCFAARHAEPITLGGCWAHVRRKFFEAAEGEPKRAVLVMRLIGELYRIERKLRRMNAGPKLRLVVRNAEARLIVERLGKWFRIWQTSNKILPRSKFGEAVNYALWAWKTLNVFLEDGRVEIDNNLVENAIRPSAIGKKNWLFIGSETAGENSAILFTLVEECRRLNINPEAYLTMALSRLPGMNNQQVGDVTPAATARELDTQSRIQPKARCA